jgi:eukaryotic-like serine/threonine-protein kinase
MTPLKPWETNWSPDGSTVRGGQGTGFPATSTYGEVRRAFVKRLIRQTDKRARKRFYREVTAYETLAGLGVPDLYDHNASDWETNAPLYLAIEYLDGGNLRDWFEGLGKVATFDQAVAIAEVLGAVLTRCHEEGYLHRDIKPLNVMLRTPGDPSTAVLVDFGISFNQADDDDLTRLHEEVGNRFLRLPEHALRGRLPVSDVTQLAGMVFWVLTGFEPRVLQDEAGLMPHQRPAARSVLDEAFAGPSLRRLLTVFDKAFTTLAANRYQTADDFLHDLRRVPMTPDDESDDLAGLMARVDEFTKGPDNQRLAELRDRLTDLIQAVSGVVKTFARQHGLELSQTAYSIQPTGTPPFGQTSLSATGFGDPPNYVAYEVEARGTAEFVASAEGIEIWRGSRPDEALEEAVATVTARAFLESRGEGTDLT